MSISLEDDTSDSVSHLRPPTPPSKTDNPTDKGMRLALRARNVPTTLVEFNREIKKAEDALARGLQNLHLWHTTAPRERGGHTSAELRNRYFSEFCQAGDLVERTCFKIFSALTLHRTFPKRDWTAEDEAQMLQSIQRMEGVVQEKLDNLLSQKAQESSAVKESDIPPEEIDTPTSEKIDTPNTEKINTSTTEKKPKAARHQDADRSGTEPGEKEKQFMRTAFWNASLAW